MCKFDCCKNACSCCPCNCNCKCKCNFDKDILYVLVFLIIIIATSGIFAMLLIIIKSFKERKRLERTLQFVIFMSFALGIFTILTTFLIYSEQEGTILFIIITVIILYFWFVCVITLVVLNVQMVFIKLRNLYQLAQCVGITSIIIFLVEVVFYVIGPHSSFYVIFGIGFEFIWELSMFYYFIVYRYKKFEKYAGWWFLASLISIIFHIFAMLALIWESNILIILTIVGAVFHLITIFCFIRLTCISEYEEDKNDTPQNGIKIEMNIEKQHKNDDSLQKNNQPYIQQQQPQVEQQQQQYQQQQQQYYQYPQQQYQQPYQQQQYQYPQQQNQMQQYNPPPANPQINGPIVYNYPQKNQ